MTTSARSGTETLNMAELQPINAYWR